MARSGSSNRQRTKSLTIRFNDLEYASVCADAERLNVPLSALGRNSMLNRPATRASRRPTVNHQVAARFLGELGRIADVFRNASAKGRIDVVDPHIAAALRDLAELRTVCFEALGRDP